MTSKLLGFCFAAVLLFTPNFAHAANWAGLGIGPNFSTYTNKPSDDLSGDTNFQVGGYLDWQLQDIWYVEGGLRYNSYGFSLGDSSFDAHYLEIPMLIKPVIDMGGWLPYALFGPMLGFKVGEGVDSGGTTLTTHAGKTVDFSLDFGLGVQVPVMPNLRVFAQFEYALGLIDAIDYADGSSGKTRGAMLTFGAMAAF